MKIAICISGHIRNLKLIPILNELKHRGVNFDTFVSTWDTLGFRLNMYETDRNIIDFSKIEIPNIKNIEIENDSCKIQEIIELCNLYNDVIEPGNYIIEREFDRKYQILSMFRKCQKSIELVSDKYDYILRTRFDCVFNIEHIISFLNNKPNDILIPNNWAAGDENHPGGGRVCDSFAFGNYESIKKYGEIFSFLKNENTPNYMLTNGVWFCPHSILLHHFRLNNINYFKENIGYDIIR